LAILWVVFAGLHLSAAWYLLTGSPAYLLLGSLSVGWAVGGGVLAVATARQAEGVWAGAAWFVLVFIIMQTARQVIFTVADYERARLPFLFTAHSIIILVAIIYLAWHYNKRGNQKGE